MTAKKKPTKPLPPVDEDGFLCLQGSLLWKWRAHDAELRTAQVEMDAVKGKIAAEIAKHPEIGALMQRQIEMFGALGTAKAELVSVQAEIEELFGVSLKECAFDDKTGRLYHLADNGSRGAPVKQTKRKQR